MDVGLVAKRMVIQKRWKLCDVVGYFSTKDNGNLFREGISDPGGTGETLY